MEVNKNGRFAILEGKKVIMWGCGELGAYALPEVQKKVSVCYCCDSNPEKWGTEFCGVSVISPTELEQLLKKEGENVIVFHAVFQKYRASVVAQLRNMGAKHIIAVLQLLDFSFSRTEEGFLKEGNKTGTVMDLNATFCAGCSACASGCPTKSIALTPTEDGYFTPEVDFETCTDCGRCNAICPVLNPPVAEEEDTKCYALMGKDDLRMVSSSGGAFTLLATEILSQGGFVCGVVLTEKFDVVHTIIDKLEDLPPMRGSKYVQSQMGDVFLQIKSLLIQEKPVLFTGTPCQVAGLKNFLGKAYETLVTVDLICHGAPSDLVFKKYLEDYYGLNNLAKFQFRTKKFGYNPAHQITTLKDGSEKVGFVRHDAFQKIMHTGIALHEICKNCHFAPCPRQGDLSIGDFWQIEKYDPRLNDQKGTSLVLANSVKGKKILEKSTKSAKLLEEVSLDFALKHNRFGENMKVPKGKKHLQQIMKHHHIDKAFNYARTDKYDVGIVGLWYGRNYGSMLTYFALHHVLEEMGLSVLMIPGENYFPLTKKNFRGHLDLLADEFYHVSPLNPKKNGRELNGCCDAFIVGSDQIWNVLISRGNPTSYFLDFVNQSNKKISYATSAGERYEGTEEERHITSHNLQRFDHVSVREERSVEICKEAFGVEATQTCDPTLLCEKSIYQNLANKGTREETEPFILSYTLDPNPEFGTMLEKLSAEKNCKVIVLLEEQPHAFGVYQNRLQLSPDSRVEVKKYVTVFQWLWYYEHAESVVTDSYHGTIFSIIFEKPFLTLINHSRSGSRFISLLTDLDLMPRLFEDLPTLKEKFSLLQSLDYTKVNQRKEKIASFSRNWLKNAVFSEKDSPSFQVYQNNLKPFPKKREE